MVYPGAVHSRHSLGVYHLAGEAVNEIKKNQGAELGIDDFDIQTMKLAGLLHDVGHGPFSHRFESGVIPRILPVYKWSHEDMSVRMVDYIVDEHNIDIDDEMLKKVKEMILASSEYNSQVTKEKRFFYDIVANGRNGIDVDKEVLIKSFFQFERLLQTMRVMDDEICYRAKEYLTIHKLFITRADLHRTVYTHAKVKGIELMVVDALVKASKFHRLASDILDPAQFWKLDDTIIKQIETPKKSDMDQDPDLKESRDLILRIRRRDLYQFCNEYAVPKEDLEQFKAITANDIVKSQKSGG